ncbi:hypothetical protein NQ318_004541 [Aromia moschata]|uniref:Reverse transcriptase zinc-binding domain-containing protein n=1 Tax=Aromia moschata TaxID=1265417 RepID=A0AAV8XPV4_9CUCU|nr:hypothetical protein NQ318_004541 [Aromia moschata]
MCDIPKTSVRLWLIRWKNKEHQSYWNHIPGQTNSKWMVKAPSKVLTDEILRLSRNQIRLVTGLITGHCHLRKHLHRMGIYSDEPICRLCNEEEETSRHIILECPALTHWRYGLLGIENPQEAFPKKNLVKGLLNLIKARCTDRGAGAEARTFICFLPGRSRIKFGGIRTPSQPSFSIPRVIRSCKGLKYCSTCKRHA